MTDSTLPATALLDPGGHGRIGPNSVIQLGRSLDELFGRRAAERVFGAAGFTSLLGTPPEKMIDETIPAALFQALWQTLPDADAKEAAYSAGTLTASYLLEHRIPSPVRAIFKILPARVGARLLLRAIERNAWTFAGSGACSTQVGKTYVIEIANNPLAMPDCAWHRGVFEKLFTELVSSRTRVRHIRCCSSCAAACRFEVSLSPSSE